MNKSRALRIVIFGAGSMAENVVPALDLSQVEVKAIIDETAEEGSRFLGFPVYNLGVLSQCEYDVVFIACRKSRTVRKKLQDRCSVPADKIISLDFEEALQDSAVQLRMLALDSVLFLIRKYLLEKKIAHVFDWQMLKASPWIASLDKSSSYFDMYLKLEMDKAGFVLAAHDYYPARLHRMKEILPQQLDLLDPGHPDYVRIATLSVLAHEIKRNNVPGSIAELGVYKGQFAHFIRTAFSGRSLYLFDTFTGFVPEEIQYDQKYFEARNINWQVSLAEVAKNIGTTEGCIFKIGKFPDTTADVDDIFAFVSLDVDLSIPTRNGLEYFYPRLAPGGYILVHDFGESDFSGCGQAVRDFCEEKNLPYTPVADAARSVIINKPLRKK